jgi:hypothetical protein
MPDQNGHGTEALTAGNYKLEKFVMYSLLNGSELRLNTMFVNLEIYEDLFSPYITAKVVVEDAYNFPEKFPIIGQEKVEISFKTDIENCDPVELIFRVYKVDSVEIEPNGKTQRYTLHMMSEGGYFNFSEYCGYAVSGTVGDMVQTVFKKHFPEGLWKDRLKVESTKDNYQFVLSKAHTPFKAINWLASKAFSKQADDYTPYLFYESLDGHRFNSIGSLIENASPKPVTYLFTAPNTGTVAGDKQELGFDSDLPNRYHKIQKFEELKRLDMVENIMSGVVSSRLEVHDLIRKEIRGSELYEKDLFEKIKKLGSEMHYRPEDPESKRLMTRGAHYSYLPSTGYTVHSKQNSIDDNFKTEALFLRRRYHMSAFLTQKFVIQVFGDSRRRVGDIVKMRVFKPQSDVTAIEDKDDKNMSGDYMITAIKHSINKVYS